MFAAVVRQLPPLLHISNISLQVPMRSMPYALCMFVSCADADAAGWCAAQAWLSSVPTVTSAGLGAEYYNTPSKYVAYSFLLVTACIITGFFFQH